jgi:hypothetical protein
MLHGQQNDLMTKQMNHRLLPFKRVRLPIRTIKSILLPAPLIPFSHRFLQDCESGPPPCQSSSVVGVIEVGALYTEAARSSCDNIARCQRVSIR